MKIISCLLLVLMIFYSCTSVYLIKYNQSDYNELNEELKREEVTILKSNHEAINGYNIRVTLDSTTWLNSENNKVVIPTSEIQEINFKSSWNGAKKGFIFGFIWGFVTSMPMLKGTEIEEKGMLLFASLLFGISSGIVYGLPIGAAIGHTDKYILHSSSDSVSVPIPTQEVGKLVREEFSSLVEKGSGYIIILWEGKEIRLSRNEYRYRGTTDKEKLYIMVPEYIYNTKFINE